MEGELKQQVNALLLETGRQTLNALYPFDIEYYFAALELSNSKGELVDYFIFPVMPQSLEESTQSLSTVKLTAGGVSVIKYPHFKAPSINLKGTFGRNFRLNLGLNFLGKGRGESTSSGVFRPDNAIGEATSLINPRIKSGYGNIKILEALFLKASSRDIYGASHTLIFYNLASGNNYLVEPVSFSMTQDDSQNSNMLWFYDLKLRALGYASAIKTDTKADLTKLVAYSNADYILTPALQKAKSVLADLI